MTRKTTKRKPRAQALAAPPGMVRKPVVNEYGDCMGEEMVADTAYSSQAHEAALQDIAAHLERFMSLIRVVEIEAQALPHTACGGNYTAGDVGCLAQIAGEQCDAIKASLDKVIADFGRATRPA
jgi:hypothetical protein